MNPPRNSKVVHFPGPRSARRTVLRAVSLAVACLVTVAVVTGVCVVCFPVVDASRSSDAILILGPASGERLATAQDLIDEGFSSTLVVSVPDPDSSDAWIRDACSPSRARTVICFRPDPYTTRGEAKEIEALSARYGWDTVTVITSRLHIARARLVVSRCYAGDLVMIQGDEPRRIDQWVGALSYQFGALAEALVTPDC